MPEQFIRLTSVAAPLIRDNIDTDAIIPSREIRTATRAGLADGLFAGWRYRTVRSRDPDPDFILNQPAFRQAQILLSGGNFGCGSSREHAVWALREYGFRAIVASGFAPIFQGNCLRNGLVPVRLTPAQVEALAAYVLADPAGHRLTVDLGTQTLTTGGGLEYAFAVDAEARECLLQGVDIIDLTLRDTPLIDEFLARDRAARPWAYRATGIAP